MRIVLATPLYPPEIADAAVYAKELARRLAENHDITVVAYTHLPEQLPGVTVIAVDKLQSRVSRILAFRTALARAARCADVVIAINGASVELPVLVTRHPRLVFVTADATAHARGGALERLAARRADAVLTEVPPQKPEILPLEPEPTIALAAWKDAWQTHLAELDSLLKNHA